VSRRARAAAFLVAALACAATAAAIAGDYGASVASQYGALRPVLVAARELPARKPIRPGDARSALEVRRVPARFLPPDALATTQEAVGREPGAAIPAGSYVVASELRDPGDRHSNRPDLGANRRPVEIEVSGAAALAATGENPEGSRVDVVVTSEPNTGGSGRTFIAAKNVELLALRQGGGAGGSSDEDLPGPDALTATLALTRREALHLIQAENFARQVRLLPRS
jgi:Flp pilus assembly protein CpaB